jgi:hypothetical protein
MKKIVSLVGAIAVSVYPHTKETGYDTIKELTDLGLKQTNMHLFLSKETLSFVHEVLKDRVSDPRLQAMNASVFLSLKPKGRAAGNFHQVTQDDYADLVKTCLALKIPFGFDSCGAPRFEAAVRNFDFLDDKMKTQMLQCSESCESFGLFSSYVNVHGDYFPCSFAEGEGEWKEGVGALGCNDFLKDVWQHPKVEQWRKKSLETRDCHGCRKCLVFEEVNI